MKKKSILSILTLLLLFFNCSKKEVEEETNATTSGVVNFWTKNANQLSISVKINGQEKFITQAYQTQPAGCAGNAGCAFFDLPPKTYDVIVKNANGSTTTFTHTVSAGGCIQFQLTN
jgi:hypothetical protein